MITEADIRVAFQQLAPSSQQQFLCLRDNAASPFTSMSEALAENSFAIPASRGKSIEEQGLFLLHSRFNHSCVPNSKIPDTCSNPITSFATRDIAAGEEICFCYSPRFECRTRQDRHRLLRFECKCKACIVGTHFQRLSDARRTLLRGLQYLTLGVDLDGRRQDSPTPIIVDPELKKAAETCSIPLSARLVYNLLSMFLMQEEGLLDYLMIERMSPSIELLPRLFQTANNAELAKLAMTQNTWTEKFCVASRLWGKRDSGDDVAGQLFRLWRGVPTKF